EHKRCPKCGGTTEVYTRIVGYYWPISQWNEGKKEEYKDRINFQMGREM
ncbi:MAG: anaerobic ribonucleoside-triphosphate reductase, partial [Clostridia bacterium]|nr:anaerobic ribonucleoside-triphosphate reductase [Clostridia bacterium]